MKHHTLMAAILFSVLLFCNKITANSDDNNYNRISFSLKKGNLKSNNDNGNTHAPKRGKPIKGHNQ